VAELWWAEAVIPVEREPDWAAAYDAILALSVEQLDCKLEEYAAQLNGHAVAAADPHTATALLGADGPERDELLLPHVRMVVREELDMVVDALSRGRPYVCAFEAAGLRVYVHCSGYASDPDQLCDAWLNVDGLGLLQAAGFVGTRVLDGGV